ncbi:MAG: hypothetical protein R6U88_01580 [Candidatus Bipolaricaulota bacterium]
MVWRVVFASVLAYSLVASGGFEGASCLDWSPDGTRFLFSHLGQLHLAQAPDGRDPQPLEDTEGVDWGRFHPSGEWIAYASPVEGGYALWRHPLEEGGEREQLHFSPAPIVQPAIAPGGERIAFLSNHDGPWDLYLLDLEGEEVRRLTRTPWPIRTPAFTPDGRSLVFVGLQGENWDLFILDLERDLLEQITTDAHFYWGPRFAPDGEWIALEAHREGRSDIYVIRRDGSELTPFTSDRWRNAFPVWSSDGDKIAYASNRVGGWVFITKGTY